MRALICSVLLGLSASLLAPRSATAASNQPACSKFGEFLTCTLGIEQWESSRLTKHRHQQWYLQCRTGDGEETSCSLDRLVIDHMTEPDGGATITMQKHASSDGSLRLRSVNWGSGILDFDVIYRDGDTTKVSMRFKTPMQMLAEISSFRGVALSSGLLGTTPSVIEYRIPEYSYVLNVPVLMGGQKTAQEKAKAAMLESLTPADRAAYEKRFEGSRCPELEAAFDEKAFGKAFEAIVREHVPDFDAVTKERTAIEKKLEGMELSEEYWTLKERSEALCRRIFVPAVTAWMVSRAQDGLNECLRRAGLSEAGRAKLFEFERPWATFDPCR